MALTTDKKLYIAVGVLAALGGALFLQNKKQKEEAAAYSLEGRMADVPKLEFSDEKMKSVDKISVTQAASDAGKATEVVLEKTAGKEEWSVTQPVKAKANDTNVKSLLDNIKGLKMVETIDPASDPATYDKWQVSANKGVHVVLNKGKDVIADLYFGEDGSRGQMTRVEGKNGVHAVKNYSAYLYTRAVKDWRDLTLFKFDNEKVKSAQIKNENGEFTFTKDKGTWTAKYTGKGKLTRFDDAKLKDMLRAYENLNADGFADGKSAADTGLDKPVANLSFVLEDGARREVQVGKTAEGSSRWAKVSDKPEIVSISSYAADWATAEPSRFAKADEKDGGAAAASPPPGMPGMPGMPAGHPDFH
jgi:hypothetical protein